MGNNLSIFLLASKKTACYLKGNKKACPLKKFCRENADKLQLGS